MARDAGAVPRSRARRHPEETALAVAHLRRRRCWYPPAMALCAGVVAVALPDGRDPTPDVARAAFAGVLLGALFAEILGCLRERRARPAKGTTPTLPWARLVGLGGVATLVGIVAAVAVSWTIEPRRSLIAPPPGVVEQPGPNPVAFAVAAALIALAGWSVVVMASRLPVGGTERAHTVLQRRTARTAVGLAAFAAVLFAGPTSFGMWVLVPGLASWMTYAQVPGHRSTMYQATFLARPVVKATERMAAANKTMLERHLARSRDEAARRGGRRWGVARPPVTRPVPQSPSST